MLYIRYNNICVCDYIIFLYHFTMKNEGWGIKEDQIPSSSHLLHQTMGSQLHIHLDVFALNLQKICRFELVLFFFNTLANFFFRTVSIGHFNLIFFACKYYYYCLKYSNMCLHMIFWALRSYYLVRCKH